MYKNIECCTIMLLWQICDASNNKPYLGLQVNARSYIETKECSFADGLL
jgi:hypothetical protein